MLKDDGIDTVYVVGLAYDYCVGKTAEDSAKNGYKTFVVMDATKPIAEDTTQKMDDSLKALGVEKIQSKDI
jgi:nicotinamidase/pyrazinamidase